MIKSARTGALIGAFLPVSPKSPSWTPPHPGGRSSSGSMSLTHAFPQSLSRPGACVPPCLVGVAGRLHHPCVLRRRRQEGPGQGPWQPHPRPSPSLVPFPPGIHIPWSFRVPVPPWYPQEFLLIRGPHPSRVPILEGSFPLRIPVPPGYCSSGIPHPSPGSSRIPVHPPWSPISPAPLQPHPLPHARAQQREAGEESRRPPPPPPYKKEIDFCLEFVKSGARGPVNGAPRGAG